MDNIIQHPAVGGFSRGFAIHLIGEAVRHGLEFDDYSLNVALNPNMFVELLLVSGINKVERDINLDLCGIRWLGAFWHIDKNVEGVGTSKAMYYVRNGLSGPKVHFYVDDTQLSTVA